MIMRFSLLFCLVVGWKACLSDVPELGDGGIVEDIDKTGGRLFPAGDPTEIELSKATGLVMKFLDAQGKALTTAIRSGKLTKQQNASHVYKFGMLFEIHITYTDDDGKAVAASQVSLRADNATLRKWGSSSDSLTAETDADGVARFTHLYLVDTQDKVKIIATAGDNQVDMEVNTDASPPDCYATFNVNKHSNYSTASSDQTAPTVSACGNQVKSTTNNAFVDISAACASKIDQMDMYLDLNLYKTAAGKPYAVREHYNGSYNGTYGDCTVMPLNLLGRQDHSGAQVDTAIDLYSTANCVVSELHANFPLLPLIVYDSQAGNGSCP